MLQSGGYSLGTTAVPRHVRSSLLDAAVLSVGTSDGLMGIRMPGLVAENELVLAGTWWPFFFGETEN
jgi:hypothetical protein